MTELGGYHDRVARVDLSEDDIRYEGIDDEDAKKYIGARGLGVKYVFDQGPDVDPLGPDNLLAFMTGPLTGTQTVMSGRIAVVTKSPLTGTVTDSHHGGWSGARLKWSGLDGLLFTGKADHPVYAVVEDGDVTLHSAEHIWGWGVHDTIDELESEVDGQLGKNLSVMAIGPGGENGVRFGCIVNEDDRASGRGGTGAVMGSKNLKAVVVKSGTKMPKPADPETFKQGYQQAMQLIRESEVTAPNEGGLSLYGTNVLMNATEEMDGLPTRNGRYTSTSSEAAANPTDHNIEAEKVSGENVRENILVDEPTCHSCPVACKKEVEVTTTVKGEEMNVRGESYEYESAFALGPNSMNDDRDKIAVMINLCNDLGIDTIEAGNMIAMAMEMTEQGKLDTLDEDIEWGDADEMIELLERIANRDGDLGDLLAGGATHIAETMDAHENSLAVKGQTIPAYDPRSMKGMGIGYATSNRGACHLRGYTPSAEILGIPEKYDPHEWEGKGDLVALFQDMHAISDSFDICKFNAFAEGIEEYVLQYNGMTGRDVTEEELLETGDRIYTLERYYNNLVGFDGSDDSLPGRFIPGDEAVPGQGGSEGQLCELEEMKEEYYARRKWVDGVVPDERLDELGIDIGPGTGVSRGDSSAPADD
ncbi:aldehyde ferredoxin oxidoreductase [Haloferax mediterranei ATCC 33500]|uniref:Aldehyde ferredoxin oxidoreductase n=1 Tax=Haloferax mediterranei (strain ATCC 33500 / DSM 1411 / JCM 8866 / NBRC 14739 / NCIMB 2177 / R-4) TaxID=523841 RepID=I3R6S0_HALMT|nr:aldehyde ferredoxin oxidoreductase family protein [Haloferax mediterranei]AFK19930.1 aldehyde ferredoxin oxidoreductase [Haloferax mediterranei ATCC 33500]AHZ23308.1 aldehyde:ferredoxin oxidoreductase [Haloferax mediterranei ATCC 33500]ELZ99474.1 aldehyde ferredoxin oxidoreductase [Haloferax mediterranei ATCC 33500]MDX5987319.1 aldehyde ferredoxin oxidoreductase family protein [Haloferax mediterranei ATCC 33500]QCQ73834.1 aldehyde ferredoxin oxidoreductase [Haloferax mediterranei ATCC 33500